MANNFDIGGHHFDFSTHKCVVCEMTREYYRDNGKPRCTGRKPERREPMPIDEDE